MQTSTLALSPWAHEAMSLPEINEISRRLVDLHARASISRSRKGWMIRVSSWAQDEHHDPIHRHERRQPHGHLADVTHAAITEYERQFVFSGEELLSIQGAA